MIRSEPKRLAGYTVRGTAENGSRGYYGGLFAGGWRTKPTSYTDRDTATKELAAQRRAELDQGGSVAFDLVEVFADGEGRLVPGEAVADE